VVIDESINSRYFQFTEVVMMRLTEMFLIILAVLFLASCAASSRVGPDYEADQLYAYDIAKKDA
jgi:hypothetical protein